MIPLFFSLCNYRLMTVSTEMRLMIVKCRLQLTFIIQIEMHLMKTSIIFQVAGKGFSEIGHQLQLRNLKNY